MKTIFKIFVLGAMLSACSVTKQPEYKSFSNLDVVSMTSQLVTLKANILFHNPNDIGATVDTDNLALYYNNNPIAKAETLPFKAKAKSDFVIPVVISFEPKKFYENNKKDLLNNLMAAIGGKDIMVNLKGNISLKVAGIKFNYPLDETQKIKF